MNEKRRFAYCAGIVLTLLCGLSVRVTACSTPVFQYALERWQPDYYKILVTHHGSLSDETKAVVEGAISSDEPGGPNMYFEEEETETPGPPMMEVFFPYAPPEMTPIWKKKLSAETIQAIAESPARKEIAKRIIGGDAAVWVFLESGDEAADTKAYKILDDSLKTMAEVLELPVDPYAAMPAPGEEATPPEPERPSFSIVKVSRDDPEEEFLVDALLRTEPDLVELDDPMAFPMFGRGRVLYSLIGEGINSDNIEGCCYYITGACSCQVKYQNPGIDMLVSADWDQVFEQDYYQEYEEPVPELTGVMPEAAGTDDASEPDDSSEIEEADGPGDSVAETESAPESSEEAGTETQAEADRAAGPAVAPKTGGALGKYALMGLVGAGILIIAASVIFSGKGSDL